MNWRWVHGSVIGTSHIESGSLCQDVSLVDVVRSAAEEAVLVAIASDGAGSASLSHTGASIACAVTHEHLKRFVSCSQGAVDFGALDAERLFGEVQRAISEHAEFSGVIARDLACTLLVAAIADESSFFFQIGDGAIVVSSDSGRRVVFWPDAGEYVNMTYFITDENAADHLHVRVGTDSVSELAVLTDGLQRLALQYDVQRPHDPFFAPLFRQLQQWTGSQEELTAALVGWMESDGVNARTDDDKTLVLAARRSSSAEA